MTSTRRSDHITPILHDLHPTLRPHHPYPPPDAPTTSPLSSMTSTRRSDHITPILHPTLRPHHPYPP
ncbi:hypothetical protein CgunFtcFv8_025352 [Champsocephalus gunnari]|uniref:Uncharacterized protein n=1 Tax=Champsocephalus gunnari TaxID=52237 RepID=A0AAN8CDD8_CHAGU|nr:hypothetical protein CgunFtcFv8_025352 [Champsocephalus gunnari]